SSYQVTGRTNLLFFHSMNQSMPATASDFPQAQPQPQTDPQSQSCALLVRMNGTEDAIHTHTNSQTQSHESQSQGRTSYESPTVGPSNVSGSSIAASMSISSV